MRSVVRSQKNQKTGQDKADILVLGQIIGFEVLLGDRDLNPKFLIQR